MCNQFDVLKQLQALLCDKSVWDTNLSLLFHHKPFSHLAPSYFKFYTCHLLKWRYLKLILVCTLAKYKLLIFVLLCFSGQWSGQTQCAVDVIGSWKTILSLQALHWNKYNYQSHYLHLSIIFICTIMQQLLLLWNHLKRGHTFQMITAKP